MRHFEENDPAKKNPGGSQEISAIQDIENLEKIYHGSNFIVWGAVPGPMNESWWEKMTPGDVVLIYNDGRIRFAGEDRRQVRNKLARTDNSHGREQCCTESPVLTCHRKPVGDAREQRSQALGHFRILLLYIAYDHQAASPDGHQEKEISVMRRVVRRFRVRVRTLLAFIANSLETFVRVKIHGRDYGSQRMCPFCGLITSSGKTCCLECGKSFKPA